MSDNTNIIPPPDSQKKRRTPLKLFFTATISFLIAFLPILILSGGRYFYYGDYNIQNLPMWIYYHKVFHNGLPAWDWLSDLGRNFIGSYTFYGLFSPYTLFSLILPYSSLPYAITYINAAKFGITAVGAYYYCRQYVRKDDSTFICGMLYAFSGWQLFNMVYHFSEIVSIFPFLLFSLDKLVRERRIICFALWLALTGITNYYFFWGTCVFLLIYFTVMTACGEYKITKKLFARLAAETLIGTGITAFVLLPSFFSLLGNNRASNSIISKNPLSYEEADTVWRIIQSMFFIPDICANGTFFSGNQLDVSSVSLYIPLFSVVGVIYVFRKNKKSWYSRLITVCGVFAVIPILNSIFSGFNGLYYGRWLYMPLLIMTMMTGKYIDDIETANIDSELKLILGVNTVFTLFSIKMLLNKEKLTLIPTMLIMLSFAWLCLLMLYCLSHKGKSTVLQAGNVKRIACVSCILPYLLFCSDMAFIKTEIIDNAVLSMYNDNVPVDTHDDSAYRVITSANIADDFSLNRGYPSIFLYNSCTPGSESDFYSLLGLYRQQNLSGRTNIKKLLPLYSLLSVKYDLYLNSPMVGGIEIEPEDIMYYLKDFEQKHICGHYAIYENTNFIPMGFTYDKYMPISKIDTDKLYDDYDDTPEELDLQKDLDLNYEADEDEKEPLISSEPYKRSYLTLKAIWLTKKQISKYGGLMTEITDDEIKDTSYDSYQNDCEARRRSAAYDFTPDKHGFTSKIDLEKDNLVFYSVPYEESFTAYVDGHPTEIEKVFGGLSAVYVPAGDHTVRFEYTVRGLKEGIAGSAVSAGALVIYLIVSAALSRRKKEPENVK